MKKTAINVQRIYQIELFDNQFVLNQSIKTEIQIDFKRDNYQLIQLLIERPEVDLNSIIYEKFCEIIELLDIQKEDFIIVEREMSLLHIATMNRNFNIIKLLLNRNSININHLFKDITKIEGKKTH